MRVMVRLFLISSIYIPRRKSLRGVRPVLYPVCRFTVSALIKRGATTRNGVSNIVRASRCGVQVIYRVLPAPGFHRWERPSNSSQQVSNLQAPGYEPGVLPLNYSDTIAGISASGRTIFRAAHMQDAGSVP